mmetsp:Transcript_19236/g.61977  ORF Transcript_19236/g.61977 Transcript_19236/m.61977 type:complete len:247 (-) Transcript_19236:939-1679(-)
MWLKKVSWSCSVVVLDSTGSALLHKTGLVRCVLCFSARSGRLSYPCPTDRGGADLSSLSLSFILLQELWCGSREHLGRTADGGCLSRLKQRGNERGTRWLSSLLLALHLSPPHGSFSAIPLQVQHRDDVVGEACRHLAPVAVPADLEDAALPRVALDESTVLDCPDVQPAVERARGEVAAVRGKGDRVDGLRVAVEDVQALAAPRVPEAHRRVEGCGGEQQRRGRVGGAASRRRPLERVDLLLVVA